MKTTIKMIALVAVITAVLNACGKKNDKPFSTFKIDGVEYKTNNVRATQGKGGGAFQSFDSISFLLDFDGRLIPREGTETIVKWGEFGKKGVFTFYFLIAPLPATYSALSPYSTTKMVIKTEGNVTKYYLEPSWFYKGTDPTDSFLAEGVFVLPEVEKV